jgi:DNA-binding MarR family transcriptional regulator
MAAMPSMKTPAAATTCGESHEAAQRVLRQFRQVFNAVKTHFQNVEKRAGIGGAQLWALSVIAERPEIGVSDLAAAMDVRQSTASNLVKGLVDKGLIRASRDGPDRRAVQLTVLPPARRILANAPGPFTGVLPSALANMDPRALRRLEKDLAVLIEGLGVDDKAATTPLADM